jgi:transcriptional regulator with XRE-family HTH domain
MATASEEALLANPVDIVVGQALARRRRALGLAETEVARRIGASAHELRDYESGATRVSARLLYELLGILRLTVHDVYQAMRP